MDSSDIFNSESQGGEEEYEEELTAAEVLGKLQEAWMNEKHSPELLEPRMDIVECMLDQISTMEGNLARLGKGDPRLPVHRLELSRIKFVVNSYLRSRLSKVQRHVFHYTGEGEARGEARARMTQEEETFATSYRESVTSLFHTLVLRNLPAGAWDPEKMVPPVPRPNPSQAVFARVMEDRAGLEVRDESGRGRDETVDLVAGSQHLVQYGMVKSLVGEGCLSLI